MNSIKNYWRKYSLVLITKYNLPIKKTSCSYASYLTTLFCMNLNLYKKINICCSLEISLCTILTASFYRIMLSSLQLSKKN